MFMKSSSSLNRFNLDLDVAKRCLFREGVVPRKLEKADFDSGLDIFFLFHIENMVRANRHLKSEGLRPFFRENRM